MRWSKIRLGECCSKIGSGATPKGGSSVYIDSGVSFIRSQNVYNLEFNYDGLVHITNESAEKLKGVTVFKGDILLNITGDSVARTCVVPESILPARVNQHVAIVRPKPEIIDYRFLNYYLASPYMQSFMLGLSVGKGASRNAMTKDMISNYEVPCPPIDVQHRMVKVLSAYDRLIENNQKQIKLLEEAAQRLYKEWFVDLRFLGYEDTRIVDDVPEGWTITTLGEISKFVRGKVITKNDAVEGDIPVVAGGLEPAYYHNKAITESPVITVSGSGANAGFTRMYYKKIWASDCSYIDATNTQYIYFTFCFLKDNKNALDNLQKGSAQPHVYAKDINALVLRCPTEKILKAFEETVSPIFNKISKCIQIIELSQQARDRLLPKLMQGEGDVECMTSAME